jgi:hypothetical protein
MEEIMQINKTNPVDVFADLKQYIEAQCLLFGYDATVIFSKIQDDDESNKLELNLIKFKIDNNVTTYDLEIAGRTPSSLSEIEQYQLMNDICYYIPAQGNFKINDRSYVSLLSNDEVIVGLTDAKNRTVFWAYFQLVAENIQSYITV